MWSEWEGPYIIGSTVFDMVRGGGGGAGLEGGGKGFKRADDTPFLPGGNYCECKWNKTDPILLSDTNCDIGRRLGSIYGLLVT